MEGGNPGLLGYWHRVFRVIATALVLLDHDITNSMPLSTREPHDDLGNTSNAYRPFIIMHLV